MRHVPVLLQEVIRELQIAPNRNYIDCTVGDGGHAFEILKLASPNGKLLGIDADAESLFRAKHGLHTYEGRVTFVRSNFDHLDQIVAEHSFTNVHGILADFGWSSPQFVERGRGFSFTQEKDLLDMRYAGNLSNQKSAADIVNSYECDQLALLFKKYGEEPLSKLIAIEIVTKRKKGYIETVGDLVEIILSVYRTKLKTDKPVPWIGGLHPATKVFQALRMEVNDELGVIERLLPQSVEILVEGGRVAIITFHSIEDRIVKHFFKEMERKGKGTIITKKPIIATVQEQKENSRSSSAKLRIFQKK